MDRFLPEYRVYFLPTFVNHTQDARLYLADLDAGRELAYAVGKGCGVWLQVIRGEVEVGGQRLGTSDGLAVEDEPTLAVRAIGAAEIMVFDLR